MCSALVRSLKIGEMANVRKDLNLPLVRSRCMALDAFCWHKGVLFANEQVHGCGERIKRCSVVLPLFHEKLGSSILFWSPPSASRDERIDNMGFLLGCRAEKR